MAWHDYLLFLLIAIGYVMHCHRMEKLEEAIERLENSHDLDIKDGNYSCDNTGKILKDKS